MDLYHQTRPAGLGLSTTRIELDFETYSEAGYVWDAERQRWTGPDLAPVGKRGLPVVGVHNSIRHPTFEILWLAYDLKNGRGWRQWRPGLPAPEDLFEAIRAGLELEAWNVAYERWVWELYCTLVLGWPAVQDHQWFCAMAKARAFSLPGSLDKAGEVVGAKIRKDKAGAALMKRLSMPVNPTKTAPRTRVAPVYDAQTALAAGIDLLGAMLSVEPEAAPRRKQTLVGRAAVTVAADAEDMAAYGRYNVTDIEAEAEVAQMTPDITGAELEWWRTHERINRRGVHIDRAGLMDCIAIVDQVFAKYNAELADLCGVDAASKVQQLQAWLESRGQRLDSLDEEHVEQALKNPLLPPDVRRVLQIRAAAGSASVKKLFSILNRLCDDDRLRDLCIYYGARTGRSTGEGPQPLNMPKAGPDLVLCGSCKSYHGAHHDACPFCSASVTGKPEEWNPAMAVQALAQIRQRSLPWIEHVYGPALSVIAGCLRALFSAAPGKDLMGADYNSIEAIGLAMLSAETWRKKVFATHGKIYEASASTMFNVPLDEILGHKKKTGQHHPLRAKGKVGELAFGYQGWLGAAQAFGMPGTDDEIKEDILRWRAASPAVEWIWGGQTAGKAAGILQNALVPGYDGEIAEWLQPYAGGKRWNKAPFYFGVEGMAVLALQTEGVWQTVYRMDGTDSGVAFLAKDGRLYCRIPSGRLLTYHNARLFESDRGGFIINYWGWNTNPKNGPLGWVPMDTWGGRLVENINQAQCRDILAPACVALERHSYEVVLHVYDEIVVEIPEGFGSAQEFQRIVETRPAWAHDWPIRAPDPFREKRYGKYA